MKSPGIILLLLLTVTALRADTFGTNTIHSQNNISPYEQGYGYSRFTLPTNGTVTKLTMQLGWHDEEGSAYATGAIYDDDGTDLAPGTRLAVTSEVELDFSVEWVDLTLTSATYLTAGDYWIGAHMNGADDAVTFSWANAAATNWVTYTVQKNSFADYPPPATFEEVIWDFLGGLAVKQLFSVYATYTPGTQGGGETTVPWRPRVIYCE